MNNTPIIKDTASKDAKPIEWQNNKGETITPKEEHGHSVPWEDKIRKDYAGIAHPEQIEATIQYWREFLDSVIHQAKEEQREEIIKNIPSPWDEYGMEKNVAYYHEELINAIRNKTL